MLARTNINTSNSSIFIFNVWLALCVLGLIMVTSVSVDFSRTTQQSMWYFSMRHGFDLAIAFAVLIAMWLIPLEAWQRYHKLLFVVGVGMLIAMLVPDLSFADAGQRRWIGNPSMAWQPTEMFKLLFVVYIAALLARKGELLVQGSLNLVHTCLIAMAPVVLLLMQFDYGTALIISIAFLVLLFATGMPLIRWGIVVTLWALIGIGLAVAADYVDSVAEDSVVIQAEPELLPKPTPEQLVPLGAGNWWGVGLGRSNRKMTYLTEAHTSHMFAVLSEELGFISAAVVVLFFLLIMLRGSVLGWYYLRGEESFRGLLMIGATLLLVLPALLNIGINIGILPVFNSNLPFISYGANHLIVSSALIGVLLSGENEYSRGSTSHAG